MHEPLRLRPSYAAFLLAAACSLAACSDDRDALDPACIDVAVRDASAEIGCITVYEPVCGCDGFTYGNECEAMRAGVVSFTSGACR